MPRNITKLRENMWLTVFLVSIVGDVGTTWIAVSSPYFVEANPLWMQYFNNENYLMLLLGKLVIVGIAFYIDMFIMEYLDEWAFPIIPIYFIYSGTSATLSNMQVISQAPTWNLSGLVVIYSLLILLVVHFLRTQTTYSLKWCILQYPSNVWEYVLRDFLLCA